MNCFASLCPMPDIARPNTCCVRNARTPSILAVHAGTSESLLSHLSMKVSPAKVFVYSEKESARKDSGHIPEKSMLIVKRRNKSLLWFLFTKNNCLS